MDTLSVAYPSSIVAPRCFLELIAIYLRLGGNSYCDIRHGSADICCLYCNHCKFFCDGDLATALELLGDSPVSMLISCQWIHPRRLGKYHSTAVAAKRSRAVTFAIMALPLVAVRIYAASRTLLQAATALNSKFAESVTHLDTEQAMGEAADDVKYAAWSTFGMLGDTGRANAMAWDVVLSAFVVGLWLAFAEADPSTMLRSTLLPWLKDEDEVAYERQQRTAASTKKSQGWLDAVKQLASVKNLTRFSRPDEGPTTGTCCFGSGGDRVLVSGVFVGPIVSCIS